VGGSGLVIVGAGAEAFGSSWPRSASAAAKAATAATATPTSAVLQRRILQFLIEGLSSYR
jgi:hypothetical protein